jgi:glycosyltransferase involved in cell wall biosynthesis
MAKISSFPLVSIVTPSYNQAEFLEHTIKSILAQDYQFLELIVIDGGSTDGSVDIIRSYNDRLAGWISEPDNGQAEAINKGMQMATGEIVAWLNSDDLYLPGAVSTAVEVFCKNKDLGMVYGDAITIDEEGRPIKKLEYPNWKLNDLLCFRIICQPAVFIRRDVFIHAGGLDPSYHFMLDHHLWIRIARNEPIQHIPRLIGAARFHRAAKNVSQASGFGRESLRLLEWMQNQPDLAPLVRQESRRIKGGAYRLNARYLLDADQYSGSLKSYGLAIINQPGYALQHWHRILYAFWGFFGGKNYRPAYLKWRDRRKTALISGHSLENWPGLYIK